MKSVVLSTLAVSAVVAPALATDLKVVNYRNLQLKPRSKLTDLVTSKFKHLDTRAETNQVSLSNQQNLYAISLSVGTPSQNIAVQIDTGSSDLWFPVTGSQLCQGQNSQCSTFGSFSTSSSTLNSLGQSFSISYGDGTKINGQFVTDVVTIGSDTLKNVQFAACSSGSSDTGIQGILGIGYETNEASVALGSGGTYPNLVADLKSQGFINSLAYSLWLNDPDSADGNVLFGGVDTAKFSGTLVSIPVVPDQTGGYSQLSMPLTGISFSSDGQNFTFTPSGWTYPALMDSGTTLMYLPDDVAEALWTSLGVVIKQQQPFLPCNYGNDASAKMTFQFNGANGANIDVYLSDLLIPAGFSISGQPACLFTASGGASDGLIILGDAFMRSAYLTYDLTNNRIAIAQAKFNVTSSNIQEISSGGIPGASTMSTLAGSTQVASGGASDLPGGGGTTAFATATGGPAALETTASIPTFHINPSNTQGGSNSGSTHNAAPLAAGSVSVFSIFGVVAGVTTLLSVCGGAMVMWF